jgi:hypothetical protein
MLDKPHSFRNPTSTFMSVLRRRTWNTTDTLRGRAAIDGWRAMAERQDLPPNSSTVIVLILGVFLTGVLGLVGFIYNFQNQKLWDLHEDVSKLQGQNAREEEDSRRIDAAVVTIGNSLTTINTSLQALKDSSDVQGTATRDLQKQVGDLDLVLRPLRVPASGPNRP